MRPLIEYEDNYKCIVADPPWPYHSIGPLGTGGRGKGFVRTQPGVSSVSRYGSMTMDELKRLYPPTGPNAHLYLWTTNAFMVQAHELALAWGFTPKTICTWGKVTPDKRASMKTGNYFRGATEHCIFAVKGRLPFPTKPAVPTLWLWPRLPHSVKPDAFYKMVEQLTPGPRLELFARTKRDGWDGWGNQYPE